MKKILSLITIVLLAVTVGNSQAPGIFNYQGVARNSVGNVLINQNINLRLTIHDVTPGGAIVYQESRALTTNPFGLFNAQVGSAGATAVTGTIAGVNWAVGNKYIQVEIDPAGGTTFINIGTAQLASVPYSLYSSSAGDLVLPYNKTQNDNGFLFRIVNSGTTATSSAIEGVTNSTAGNAYAIKGTVSSTTPGGFSAGLVGQNNGTGGLGIGVIGTQAGSGWGVYGTTPSGIGVYGLSTSGFGIYGQSTTGISVYGIQPSNGTGGAGYFQNTNTANTTATLTSATNGAGDGVSSITTGTGRAGFFQINNAANVADALFASTNGGAASWALRATSTGLQGAGIFTVNNAASTANALRVTTNGLGRAAFFDNTNAANTATTVQINSNSTGGLGLQVNQTGTGQVTAISGTTTTTTAASAGVSGIDFSSGGVSPIDGRTFGVLGTTGTTGIGVGAYALSGGTALRAFGGGATGFALSTTGRISMTGINEGLNRVLTSDAAGNATWQPIGGAGGVTGSGTLNFIPKWTPSGTNLGNSQIFDDGTNVGINTPAPTNKLEVTQASVSNSAIFGVRTSTTGTAAAISGSSASQDASAVGVLGTISSTTPGGFSAAIRGANNGTGGLGIGVYGSQAGSGWGVYGTTPSGIGVYGLSTNGFGIYGQSTTGVSVYGIQPGNGTNNAGYFQNTNTANTAPALLGVTNGAGAAISGSTTGTGQSGLFAISNSANTSNAIEANTNGTGWAGNFNSTNATPKALKTTGGVQLTGIGEAPNYVLTSDASGNATWQPLPPSVASINVPEVVNMMGPFNAGTTYELNDLVSSTTPNVYFYSLIAGNAGNTPETSPAAWQQVEAEQLKLIHKTLTLSAPGFTSLMSIFLTGTNTSSGRIQYMVRATDGGSQIATEEGVLQYLATSNSITCTVQTTDKLHLGTVNSGCTPGFFSPGSHPGVSIFDNVTFSSPAPIVDHDVYFRIFPAGGQFIGPYYSKVIIRIEP